MLHSSIADSTPHCRLHHMETHGGHAGQNVMLAHAAMGCSHSPCSGQHRRYHSLQYPTHCLMLQASKSRLHMKVLVTDYTLEKAQAKAATAVDPTGLIAFARQAPDAQSRPQLQSTPQGRSRNSRQQQSLQASTRLAVHDMRRQMH